MRTAFLFIASIHIVGLVTLLTMQGCKQREQATEPPVDNATAQTFDPMKTPVADSNTVSTAVVSNTTPVDTVVPAVTPVATTSDYIVVKGDSFYTIGKAHGVSTKAIQEANPGVDSAKLKIGQPLKLPAPSSAPASAGTTVMATTTEGTYTVKSGDTLTSIAKSHGITLKELRTANSLTSDRIKVGDKLKIPAKAPGAMIAPAAHTIAAAPAAPMTTTVTTH